MDVFIDESGDPGTGGTGTQWLTFGAVCCRNADSVEFERMVRSAETALGKDIHLSGMRHADKRGVAEAFGTSGVPWIGIIVASDTRLVLPGSALGRPDYQYNYALGFVLERVSHLAASVREPATVYLESRRASRTNGSIEYIRHLKATGSRRLNWEYFDPAKMQLCAKGTKPGLCVADALAHATFHALERDERWGHTEPAYLAPFAAKIWRGTSGTTPFPMGAVLMPTSNYRPLQPHLPMLS